jgi:hypothetical protein
MNILKRRYMYVCMYNGIYGLSLGAQSVGLFDFFIIVMIAGIL